MHCTGSRRLSQMNKMQEELNKSKEALGKQLDQASQIQSRMLQIVAAEQEDKRRIVRYTHSSACSLTRTHTRTLDWCSGAQQESLDMLLTIAAEEKLPVNKFLSVRSKLDTVGRAEWCALLCSR